jgi:hypothetical protein
MRKLCNFAQGWLNLLRRRRTREMQAGNRAFPGTSYCGWRRDAMQSLGVATRGVVPPTPAPRKPRERESRDPTGEYFSVMLFSGSDSVSSRVPGPRHCPARAPSAAAPDQLLYLLSPVEDASVAGDGLSEASPSPCSGPRQSGRGARGGGTASP